MTAVAQKQERIDYRKLAQWTLIAGVASAVVNSIIFFIAQALGVFEGVVIPSPAGDMPFSVIPVIGSSIMFILVGGGVMWVIDRFSQKPISTWRIVAVVALVLSLAQPFLIPNGGTGFYITLILMHIAAGVITIYLLTTRVQAE